MNRYEKIMARIAKGETIMIDGGTGTEIEKRGAAMIEGAWNAGGALTHPEIVRSVHEDYIRAGGELIITNTFSTSRYVLQDAGLGDQFESINRRSVELALEARENMGKPDVLVAGGITNIRHAGQWPEIEDLAAAMEEQAAVLAATGVDLIILEMMRYKEFTLATLEAARKTGLPVWVGFSVRPRETDGAMALFGGESLEDSLQAMKAQNVPLIFLMHSLVENIDKGLDIVQAHWDGPIGVYAHSGRFALPNWIFDGVISEQDYCDLAVGWVNRGVQVIGGCCGIGVCHMETLHDTLAKSKTKNSILID